jgi:type IV pilus assembly protein PilC
MAVFRFVARDKKGGLRRGMIEAETVTSLVKGLREKGLYIMSVSPLERKATSMSSRLSKIVLIKPKVKPKDLIIFTRQFAMMLEAGIDIVKTLSILEEQTDHMTLKEVIGKVKGEVEKGKSLAEAMGTCPKVFDRFYISMVEAAQTSGSYERVLMDIATDMERRERMKSQIKSALMPSLLTLGFALILCFSLIKFVVPQFLDLYSGIAELPRPTRMLLVMSGMLQGRSGIAFLIGVIAAVFGFRKAISTETGRYIWDEVKLKIPVLGPLMRKVAVAHFSRTLGLLLKNAVDYLLALDIVANAAKNAVLSQVLREAKRHINRGMPLSKPLMDSGIFSPMVTQMIASGEEAAKLPEMLEKISDIYEEEINRSIERLSELMTPLLTLVIGVIVGGILLGLYMPVFQIGDLLLRQP